MSNIDQKKQNKLSPVEKIVERKLTNCPFTIVQTRDEYHLIDECCGALSKNRFASTIYLWDGGGSLQDKIFTSKPPVPMAAEAALSWFLGQEESPVEPGITSQGSGMGSIIGGETTDSLSTFDEIPKDNSILFLLDAEVAMSLESSANPDICAGFSIVRDMKNAQPTLMRFNRSIIFLSRSGNIPVELMGYCSIIKDVPPSEDWINKTVTVFSGMNFRGTGTTVPPVAPTEEDHEAALVQLPVLHTAESRGAVVQ